MFDRVIAVSKEGSIDFGKPLFPEPPLMLRY